MPVFRPFNSKSRARRVGKLPPAFDFDLAIFGAMVLGAVAMGFALKQAPKAPAAAPAADQVDTAVIERDEPIIWDALLRYGQAHGGRMPSFDSKRLPIWWQSYSRHPIFEYRYVLKSKYVDVPIERMIDRDPSPFIRPVVTTGPDGHVRPVLRFSERPKNYSWLARL